MIFRKIYKSVNYASAEAFGLHEQFLIKMAMLFFFLTLMSVPFDRKMTIALAALGGLTIIIVVTRITSHGFLLIYGNFDKKIDAEQFKKLSEYLDEKLLVNEDLQNCEKITYGKFADLSVKARRRKKQIVLENQNEAQKNLNEEELRDREKAIAQLKLKVSNDNDCNEKKEVTS